MLLSLDAALPEPLCEVPALTPRQWVTPHTPQQALVSPRLLLTQDRLVPPCEHSRHPDKHKSAPAANKDLCGQDADFGFSQDIFCYSIWFI